MSSRGRGRGRGQVRTGSPEAESSSQPTASTSASAASSAVPSQARSSSSSVANLLRKNDYTKKSNTPTMKFTPNMARRKPAQVDLYGLQSWVPLRFALTPSARTARSVVKKVKLFIVRKLNVAENRHQEKDDKPAFNKPLGRGRGKPMMQEMTASSTFAMGPSQGLSFYASAMMKNALT